MIRSDLAYSTDHEWVSDLGQGSVRIGITDFAQKSLGDIVFVQLPELGRQFKAGESIGEVESTKSVSDIFAPVSGTVVATNTMPIDTPEIVNDDPYGDGWLVEIELADAAELASLMDADAYAEHSGS